MLCKADEPVSRIREDFKRSSVMIDQANSDNLLNVYYRPSIDSGASFEPPATLSTFGTPPVL